MHLFCIKYKIIYSDAKSRDRFIAANLSAARAPGQSEGHVVKLVHADHKSAGCQMRTREASLSIHKSKES